MIRIIGPGIRIREKNQTLESNHIRPRPYPHFFNGRIQIWKMRIFIYVIYKKQN